MTSRARNLARLVVDSGGDVDASSLGNVPPANPKVRRRNTTLRSNMQPSGSDRYTDDISSHITPNTYAVIIALRYTHNGSSNHGYLSGYFCQQGNETAPENRGHFERSHFDWYYNDFQVEILVPWNSASSGNLITQIESSLFTGNNYYGWLIKGVLEK